MTVRRVLAYPHPKLLVKAAPVTELSPDVIDLIQDLKDTMHSARGVGLAATQVGAHHRVFVMHASALDDATCDVCFINPEIIAQSGHVMSQEGCLSFPGLQIQVPRAAQVVVRYRDEQFHTQTFTADKLAARCIQHELEHLDGHVFLRELSDLKRERALKAYRKHQLQARAL